MKPYLVPLFLFCLFHEIGIQVKACLLEFFVRLWSKRQSTELLSTDLKTYLDLEALLLIDNVHQREDLLNEWHGVLRFSGFRHVECQEQVSLTLAHGDRTSLGALSRLISNLKKAMRR